MWVYIYILLYTIYYYILYYIIYYTILYIYIYIYHCPWKTATVKSAHSSHGFLRCRGTVHMNFGATTLGGPFFVELVVVIQHHTGHLHQAKQRRKTRLSRPEKSLNECRNGMNDSLITWFTHWICIYIYIRLRYVFPPSKHMPQMSHVRASFQRSSSNRRRASFTRCPPSRFDRRFTPRAQIIMAFADGFEAWFVGGSFGNWEYLSIYLYLFIYLFIYLLFIYIHPYIDIIIIRRRTITIVIIRVIIIIITIIVIIIIITIII